ncbi:uncharacterized protein LOC105435952 [Cucumis sativus]|uniref:Uncharacterized protein n=1 Tax=Cucumis sativus TaxID=3659 RepID=A0A0A0KN31_CUCSA|nr:uncharacterized protein LOC105435952 [Cucumis sativus]KGN49136.1 hypothetical protein Csa_004265 [Cucumis sativus]
MELADIPKSGVIITPAEVNSGLEKSVISDETNRFQYNTKSDSFIIDMDNLSNKEISHNSRISRNFSRKGMLRGGNKIGQDNGDGDEAGGESISPIGGGGSSTLEKQAVVGREELVVGALSHETAISSTQRSSGAEKLSMRRNSFKRSTQPCSWYLDPRKIFLFCATLSCVGTMLLIYLTFSSGLLKVEESESGS